MHVSKGARKTFAIARNENQMNMIGHQAVGPHLNGRFAAVPGEEIAIDLLVARFEENRLTPVATLRDVMRAAGNDDAGETGHGESVRQSCPQAKKSMSAIVVAFARCDTSTTD
jgi:hypothetical protein